MRYFVLVVLNLVNLVGGLVGLVVYCLLVMVICFCGCYNIIACAVVVGFAGVLLLGGFLCCFRV